VVDGRIAFTGGMNIGDEYARGLAGEGWRDAHIRVEGPAVRELEAVFLESWFRADGPGSPWRALLRDPAPAAVADDPAASPNDAVTARCAVLADGPVYRRRRMRNLLISALDSSTEHVTLASPYLAPGGRLMAALKRAARRGVAVELLLAGRTDHPILRRAARALMGSLDRAGVRVFEYERAMMHAKVCVFDDELATLGTSNLDRQSLEHSYEVNLVVEGGELPAQLRRSLEGDIRESRPVDARSLAARGPFDRLLDRAASLILFFL
jgi:cardiolipin synthase